MECPLCRTQLRIDAVSTRVTGDSSAETPTRVYAVQQLCCRSPQCANYGKVVREVKILRYGPAEPTAE